MSWIQKPNAGGKGTYYGPSQFYEYSQALFHTKEWLYGDWSEEKLHAYEALNRVPVMSGYMDYLLSLRTDNEYLARYGMDYSDIHDPRKLKQTGAAGNMISQSEAFFSKNIHKLYGR